MKVKHDGIVQDIIDLVNRYEDDGFNEETVNLFRCEFLALQVPMSIYILNRVGRISCLVLCFWASQWPKQ